jgi:hypothetical protein
MCPATFRASISTIRGSRPTVKRGSGSTHSTSSAGFRWRRLDSNQRTRVFADSRCMLATLACFPLCYSATARLKGDHSLDKGSFVPPVEAQDVRFSTHGLMQEMRRAVGRLSVLLSAHSIQVQREELSGARDRAGDRERLSGGNEDDRARDTCPQISRCREHEGREGAARALSAEPRLFLGGD